MKKHLLMLELNRGPSGIEYLKAAKKLGIFITLVSFKPKHYLKMEKQLGSSILDYIDNILVIDTHHNINKLMDTIIGYHNIYKIDGIMGTYDLEMLQASLLAEKIGLIGTNPLAIEVSRNKFLTRKALYERNIKVPKFALVDGLEEVIEFGNKIGYPCVLKPVDGQGSDNVVLITSPEEFKEPIEFHRNNPIYYRGVKKYPKLLVEEYLEGPLVSVETVSYQNEVHVLGITDRSVGKPPYFVAETASFPAKMDHEHEVIQMVIDALQAIHFDFGPAHTEVIITKDGPRIVEINPRLAGRPISLMMNWSFGRSIHEEIVKMYMGMPFSFESKRKGIGAYLRIFSVKTGILKNIEGLDLAYKVPGIKNIYLEHELGDLVSHSPKGLADGLGVISAFGEDKEEIIKNLYEARSKLNVVVNRVDQTFLHFKGVFKVKDKIKLGDFDGESKMINIQKNSDSAIIVVHEIYGINKLMKYVCQSLSEFDFDVFCPNLLERETPFDYSQEEDAYSHFMENVGFTNALVIIKKLLSDIKDKYKKIFVIGYSVGATVAWLCSEEQLFDGVIGYYGSRIRNYMEISPCCPTLLFFPQEEKSFNVDEFVSDLENKKNLEVHKFNGQLGFCDPFSPKYNENQQKKHLTKCWFLFEKHLI